MPKVSGQNLILLLCFTAFLQCHTIQEKPAMQYGVLRAGMFNDSLSAHQMNYKEDFNHWKSVYADCLRDSLFPDAFYLGLQANLWIGGICNQVNQNVNKQISVLDTSANGNLFDILAINKSANCFSKINLNKSLQDSFYNELIRNLKNSEDYMYLADLIDTNQIDFRIATLIDYSIRPDTLVNILGRTQDSSLLLFRQILTTPGNALLARACMIFGFYAEFHLKRELTLAEGVKFKNEVYFKLGVHGEKGSIKLLSNKNLQININKNYTVFGQFYVFNN